MRDILIVIFSPLVGATLSLLMYASVPRDPSWERYYIQYFLIGYVLGLFFSVWCVMFHRAGKLSPRGRIISGLTVWCGLIAAIIIYAEVKDSVFAETFGIEVFMMVLLFLIVPSFVSGLITEGALGRNSRAR